MNVGPLTWCNAEVLTILFGDITLQTHAVQRPLVSIIQKHNQILPYCHLNHHLHHVYHYLRAIDCMIAVRKDCGLKKPASHTAEGNRKSDDQVSSSLILASRSMNHMDRPDMDG